MAQVNPYTGERDTMLRVSRAGVVVRLEAGEAEAVQWAQYRGYLPEAGVMRWREDGRAALRLRPEDAGRWHESVNADPDAFMACLARPLSGRIMGAHVALERWYA